MREQKRKIDFRKELKRKIKPREKTKSKSESSEQGGLHRNLSFREMGY